MNVVLIIRSLLCQTVVQAYYSRIQLLNEIQMDKKEAAFFLSHGSRAERSPTPPFCYDRAQEGVCEKRHMECKTEEFREYLCTKENQACPANLMCTIDGIWCPVHYRTHCANICDIFGQGQSKCKNGGTCINNGAESYTCICPQGFTGKDCERDIDECLANPCQHSASCNNVVGNYSCNCPSRFTGQNCELVCHPMTSDVLYLLDAGNLLTFDEFQGAIDALQYVSLLLLGSNDVRVSLVKYAAEPEMKFNFTNGLTETKVHQKIAILSKEVQPSNHTKALEYVYQNGFTTRNGARNDTRKVIVHLTNGRGIDNDTIHLADMLKNDGKILIEIGFGDFIDRKAMLNLASYPYMFYHLGEKQFTDVKVLRSLKSLSEYEVCNV
ncbi:hypothetical protein ACJMK2_012161 [Sinanodonta woodiana]|uniref:Uncharacterized protein n=1 Tax=Sinanodonta woodiana TaxID=1069815 RepID=A0ABD3V7B4_SINWO